MHFQTLMAWSSNGGGSFAADFRARMAIDAKRKANTLETVTARHGVLPANRSASTHSKFKRG